MRKREKKLVTFMLDEDIRDKIDNYCDDQQMSLSQFIRLSLLEKLEKPVVNDNQQSQNIDLSTIELALQQLHDQQQKIGKDLDYLIDKSQSEEILEGSKIEEAMHQLLDHQPKTYQEAGEIIKDNNLMIEVINKLLAENKVVYKRRKLIWL
ncbi:MAG: hypothetical protein ACXABI_05135 [Candidatus Hodarchaeales archaeon]|jgi:hypothetical protein